MSLVDARPIAADARVGPALVHVHAGLPAGGEGEPLVADALETTGTVPASTVLADPRQVPALVNISTVTT